MRRYEQCDAALTQAKPQIPQAPPRDRMDTRRGLIEKHDAWLVQERRRERESLLPSSRERPGALPNERAEIGKLYELFASLVSAPSPQYAAVEQHAEEPQSTRSHRPV